MPKSGTGTTPAEIASLIAPSVDPRTESIARENDDMPYMADCIRAVLALKLGADSPGHLWDAFRNALLRARDANLDDPVEFATRQLDALQQLKDAPQRAYRGRLKHAEADEAKEMRKLESRIEKASKSAEKSARVFPTKDAKYVNIIGFAENHGYIHKSALVERDILKIIGPYKPPHWDHVTQALRALAWSVLIHEGKGKAFSLHLGKNLSLDLLSSPREKPMASLLQGRIHYQLKKLFPQHIPDFWFGIEKRDARLHLHGGVELPRTPDAFACLQKALRAAGGEWTSGAAHKQLVMKDLHGPYNWAAYVLKAAESTHDKIGVRVVASSQPLLGRARVRWPSLREELPRAPL